MFISLQILDAMTTLVFLHRGIPEANPLMRAVMALAGPRLALLLSKGFAIGLAVFASRSGRTALLRKVNLVFGMCVLWNLITALYGRG